MLFPQPLIHVGVSNSNQDSIKLSSIVNTYLPLRYGRFQDHEHLLEPLTSSTEEGHQVLHRTV